MNLFCLTNSYLLFKRLFTSLTIKKIKNLIRLYFYYYLVILFKKFPDRNAYPASITLEPTNLCNLNCPECPTGNFTSQRPKGKMNPEMAKSILDNCYEYLINLSLYFQGEPFLNQALFSIIRYGKEKNVFVNLSTNGHFLDESTCTSILDSGLDYIIISLDGTSPETYSTYRQKGNFEMVLKGIRLLIEAKRRKKTNYPIVELQFLVFRHNEHEIQSFKKIALQLGANRAAVKTAQILNTTREQNLIPSSSKYSRYKKDERGNIVLKSKLHNRCWRQWSSCVITWDGWIVPCCFDKDLFYKLGNVSEQPFEKIWNGNKKRMFQKMISSNRKNMEMCQNCTEGL